MESQKSLVQMMQVLENSVKRQENGKNIGLMGIQKVSWEEGGTEPADDYTHLYGKGNTVSIII